MRLVAALVAGIVLAWTVGSCGSGGSGTVAQQARTAASTTATQQATNVPTTTGQTQRTATGADATATATQPRSSTATTETTTATQPQKTVTATETTTVTQPTQGNTTATAVQVTPTATTGGESDGGGMPWWGWLLIALAAGAIAMGIFALGRRGAGGTSAQADTGASAGPVPGAAGDPPPPPSSPADAPGREVP